uniref:Uncharacterized protein n=1 Tax=Anguilla anguilla TaxID=7936 RepID=A0A0E9PVB9_ANGAN
MACLTTAMMMTHRLFHSFPPFNTHWSQHSSDLACKTS